jgi:hypothetical protein
MKTTKTTKTTKASKAKLADAIAGAVTADPRAVALQAVKAMATAAVQGWRHLYLAAFGGWEPTPEAVKGLWSEAGDPVTDGTAAVYSSQLSRAFKLGDHAGGKLPALDACTSARAVHEAVKVAYDAAGLKSAKGAKPKPETVAKEADKRAKAAEADVALLAKGAKAAKDPTIRAAMEAAAADAADRARAAREAADAAKAAAEAAKGSDPVKATPPSKASPAERTAARVLLQDVSHQLAALAARCAADPVARGAVAGIIADAEAKARALIGAIDEAVAADAASK